MKTKKRQMWEQVCALFTLVWLLLGVFVAWPLLLVDLQRQGRCLSVLQAAQVHECDERTPVRGGSLHRRSPSRVTMSIVTHSTSA